MNIVVSGIIIANLYAFAPSYVLASQAIKYEMTTLRRWPSAALSA